MYDHNDTQFVMSVLARRDAGPFWLPPAEQSQSQSENERRLVLFVSSVSLFVAIPLRNGLCLLSVSIGAGRDVV